MFYVLHILSKEKMESELPVRSQVDASGFLPYVFDEVRHVSFHWLWGGQLLGFLLFLSQSPCLVSLPMRMHWQFSMNPCSIAKCPSLIIPLPKAGTVLDWFKFLPFLCEISQFPSLVCLWFVNLTVGGSSGGGSLRCSKCDE